MQEPNSVAEQEATSKSGITPAQFTQIFKVTVEEAAKAFVERWNNKNPNTPCDIRFVLHKNKIPNHKTIKAQAMLTLEVKRNFDWVLTSRAAVNLTSVKQLELNETDYTFELWSQMFGEITQIGFVALFNYLDGKENGEHSTATGNFQAVEDEAPESI